MRRVWWCCDRSREEPSCGRLQGSCQLICPLHKHASRKKGRQFNSGRKKLNMVRRSQTDNSGVVIRQRYHESPVPTVIVANRLSLGGNRNWFRYLGPRGAFGLSLEADSAVPLARAVVLYTSRLSRVT